MSGIFFFIFTRRSARSAKAGFQDMEPLKLRLVAFLRVIDYSR